jgi:hypothetical protein
LKVFWQYWQQMLIEPNVVLGEAVLPKQDSMER